jgi:hypothetical protein
MKTSHTTLVLLISLAWTVPLRADEIPARSKIVGVDLFKNGLAIVKREVTLGKSGTYVLEDVPHPVYGTFWIESSGVIDALVQMRDVDVPVGETNPGSLQEDFAGKKVTVYLKGDKRAPIVGTMLKIKPPRPDELPAPGRFIVIQNRAGRTYIEPSEISSVEGDDPGEKVKRRQPRLVLTIHDNDKAETKVTIRYLTHGISWVPSYKLDITDPKLLALEQHAVVRNELTNLDGAEIRLISGYPSVQFAHVRSLLSPRTTWAGFFQEVGMVGANMPQYLDNSVMMQNVAMNNYRHTGAVGISLGAIPTGEGVDLHYQPIGKRSLEEGDTLAVTVARGKTDYERIVEWMVPDTRNEYGQQMGNNGNGNGKEDSPWDALKFKNPLPFPMTTGPAMVVSGGNFNGQRTSYWVNAGEETVLHVGKALSVRTRALEHELQAKNGSERSMVWIGGRQFRKSTVEGELDVSNHRKESINMVVRRRFSGELVNAEGAPRKSLLEEGVFSINLRNELVWTFALKAGEEKKLKYTYSVLVPY